MLERSVSYNLNRRPRDGLVRNTVAFHHIPKTAGSSFTQLLRTLFSSSEICDAVLDHELDNIAPDQFRMYRLFTGHYSYDAMDRYFQDAVRLTFLRDPIQRCISQYYNWHDANRYVKSWMDRNSNSPENLSALAEVAEMSLADFVQSTNHVIADSSQNMLTRYLARRRDWQQVRGYYDEDLLAEAKANLVNRFEFFGLTEQFEKSKLLLAHCLGIRPWGASDTLLTNKNPNKKSFDSAYVVSDHEAELLHDYNRMDVELYRFAADVFNKRFEAGYRDLLEDYFECLTQNDFGINQPPDDQYRLDMESTRGVRGLHYLEETVLPDKTKRLGRWSGLEAITIFELPILLKTAKCLIVEVEYLDCVFGRPLTGEDFSLDFKMATKAQESQLGNITTLQLCFPVDDRNRNKMLHTLRLTTPISPVEGGLRNVGVFISNFQAYSL